MNGLFNQTTERLTFIADFTAVDRFTAIEKSLENQIKLSFAERDGYKLSPSEMRTSIRGIVAIIFEQCDGAADFVVTRNTFTKHVMASVENKTYVLTSTAMGAYILAILKNAMIAIRNEAERQDMRKQFELQRNFSFETSVY